MPLAQRVSSALVLPQQAAGRAALTASARQQASRELPTPGQKQLGGGPKKMGAKPGGGEFHTELMMPGGQVAALRKLRHKGSSTQPKHWMGAST